MQNILYQKDYEEIIARIGQLRPDTKRQWGRMNVNQMICHVSDPVRGALGLRQYKDAGNIFYRTILKWLLFYVMPFPKNSPTDIEFNQLEGTGTPVTGFGHDLQLLLQLLEKLHATPMDGSLTRHPLFGKLSAWEWGRLTANHLDHHLRQFGV